METLLFNDSETASEAKPKSTDPLSDLLADYKEAPPSPPVAPVAPTEKSVLDSSNTITQNQPTVEYYKTGKKAGQPKPPKKVRVTYTPSQTPASLSGELLTGALFITLVDLIMPILMVGLNNRFSKQKIKVKDLQLTAAQQKELAPIADRVVKQINIEANPTMLLICSMLGIYGANFAVQKFGSNENKKQDEKINNNPTQNTGGQNNNNGFTSRI